MATDAIRRDGALTELSLADAVASEMIEGRVPSRVAVGTDDLAVTAHRILAPATGLDVLRSTLARVEFDASLGEAWELRE